MPPDLIALVALALIFVFLNGVHDSANLVSTLIASRALRPATARLLTALAELAGPFLFGVAVAETIGSGLIQPQVVTVPVLIAALVGAIGWNIFTWLTGIPSSSSHALIGGLLGAVLLKAGSGAILLPGLMTVLAALFLAPLLGLAAGYGVTRLVFRLARNAHPKVNWFFKRAQVFTVIGLGLSHGANDAQKSMGIITLGLLSAGVVPTFEVPLWVIAACAVSISLGTAVGGQKLIRTVGGRFFKVRPVHGFCTQLASAVVILGAALVGGPVSASQVVSSALMGSGAAHRANMVRWHVARQLLFAWLLTMPAAGLLAAGVLWLFFS
ncbi:MAG: inorganic phosphate transporter [Anaerolineae bacterium]|jgi:PiT family inorganic phosphate transporter|nr:inorganic phosphate transporter [Anaerolineae bacterium]